MPKSMFAALIICAAIFSSAFLGMAEVPKDGTEGVPTIVSTNPADGATGVTPGSWAYVVVWSEAIASSSPTIVPNPSGGSSIVWSGGNTILSIFATWAPLTTYTLTFVNTIPAPTGDLIKEFSTSDGVAPTIVSITPIDGGWVPTLFSPFYLTWSEAMNPAVGTVTIAPVPPVAGSWAWSVGNTVYTYSGATWAESTLYTLTFSNFKDFSGTPAGGDLVKTFDTVYRTSTIATIVPTDGATGVLTNSNVVVTWSQAMNPAVGTVGIVPARTGTWAWSAGNTTYTFTPAANWAENTLYTLTFTGFTDIYTTSAVGDLVKTFTTIGVLPTITTIVPADGATGVAINANVVVTWSESMNSSAGTVNIVPARSGTWVWSGGNTVYTFTPAASWSGVTYTLTFSSFKDVSGMSAGGDLVKAFTVIAPPPVSMETIVPADGATGVSQTANVVVTWSEAMNPVLGSVSIVPAPLVAGTWAWSVGNSVYSYSGAIWPGGQLITLTFSNFMSAAGGTATGDMVKIFTTTETPPTIVTIVPADGATGVLTNANIIVRWSEPMNNAVGTVSIVPVPPITGTWTWSANRIWYNYTGATWSYTTMYSLTFTGFKDSIGTAANGDLGKQFTTIAGPPPTMKATGVNVMKSGSNNVVISWTNPSASAYWDIYVSTNKASVKQPGNLLGTVAMGTGSYTHVNGQNTGTTLYYLVIGRSGGGVESGYSTMGVKVHKSFYHNTYPATNIMWITIPQDSGYDTASDIVMELEGALVGPGLETKINVVGKWLPGYQTSTAFFYDGIYEEWTGDDFAIYPGDGLYLSIKSNFNWVVCGVDTETLLNFTHNSLPKTNIMWFDLPATCDYQRASDIVMELEGNLFGPNLDTKINVIGYWQVNSQMSTAFFYDTDFEEWGGDDFLITPGMGIYFSVTSSFTWTPELVTEVVP